MIEPTATEFVLIDSSGWLECLTDDSKAVLFLPYFSNDSRRVLISPIIIYEVRKILLVRHGPKAADDFFSQAEQYESIEIDRSLAQSAVSLSILHRLPMADAFIYASAMARRAELITSDAHFKNLPGVTVL